MGLMENSNPLQWLAPSSRLGLRAQARTNDGWSPCPRLRTYKGLGEVHGARPRECRRRQCSSILIRRRAWVGNGSYLKPVWDICFPSSKGCFFSDVISSICLDRIATFILIWHSLGKRSNWFLWEIRSIYITPFYD